MIVALVCVLILSYTHLKSSSNSTASVEPTISEFAAPPTQSPRPSVVELPSGALPQSVSPSAKQPQAEPAAPNWHVGRDSDKKPSGSALPRSKVTSLQSATKTAKPQATASPAATANASPRRKGSFWTPIDSVD
jgi:hypothetical protein